MHISAQTRLYFNSRINLFLYKWDYDSVLMRWAKNSTFFCKYAFFFIANFRNKWMVWTFNIDLWTKPIKNRFAIMQAMTFHLSRRFQQLKWKNLFKFKKKVAIKNTLYLCNLACVSIIFIKVEFCTQNKHRIIRCRNFVQMKSTRKVINCFEVNAFWLKSYQVSVTFMIVQALRQCGDIRN